MRTFISCFLLGFCIESALHQALNVDEEKKFKKIEWLVGTWHRINGKTERSGIEIWKKISNTELHGRGIALKGNDTTFVERLKIVVKERDLYYVADVPENKGLVYFKFTQITDQGFTCENPDHDFPKKIQYELAGTQLKANISGNGNVIEYLFEKQK